MQAPIITDNAFHKLDVEGGDSDHPIEENVDEEEDLQLISKNLNQELKERGKIPTLSDIKF